MRGLDNSIYTKKELLMWLNDLLKIDVHTIEELSNGAAFCQLLDVFCCGSVKMQKINWSAKLQHQNLNNLKILSTSMFAIGIDKKFDATRISQKKTQDILQLLQWFRKYFLTNHLPSQSYDPISRRKSLSVEKHNTQIRASLQNNRKQKSINLIKPLLSHKRQPSDIIPQQTQLQNCFRANKQIQKILVEKQCLPAEKKLEMIKNILLKNNRNQENPRNRLYQSIVTDNSQSSNVRTNLDRQLPINNVQTLVKIQESHDTHIQNKQSHFTPSNFQFNSSKVHTSQMLLQSLQKDAKNILSHQKSYKSQKRSFN